jgi:hypothetical protein
MRLASLVTVSVGPHGDMFPATGDVRTLGAVEQESATEVPLVQNGMPFAALQTGDQERCGALG